MGLEHLDNLPLGRSDTIPLLPKDEAVNQEMLGLDPREILQDAAFVLVEFDPGVLLALL